MTVVRHLDDSTFHLRMAERALERARDELEPHLFETDEDLMRLHGHVAQLRLVIDRQVDRLAERRAA